MKKLKRFNEEFHADGYSTSAETKLKKPETDGQGGYPFPVYAIWAPNRQGYLAGMPYVNDDSNVVRDNELRYKQIKLFIVEEHAQDYITELNRTYKKHAGDIQTIKQLLIIRLVPEDWMKPMIYPN